MIDGPAAVSRFPVRDQGHSHGKAEDATPWAATFDARTAPRFQLFRG